MLRFFSLLFLSFFFVFTFKFFCSPGLSSDEHFIKVCFLSGCSHVKCHDYDDDHCRAVYGETMYAFGFIHFLFSPFFISFWILLSFFFHSLSLSLYVLSIRAYSIIAHFSIRGTRTFVSTSFILDTLGKWELYWINQRRMHFHTESAYCHTNGCHFYGYWWWCYCYWYTL